MVKYYDSENEVTIVYIALPVGINEVMTLNEDGTYTVFISTDLCQEKQKEAYDHALRHIRRDDFYKHGDVQQIERETHEEGSSLR